MVYELEFLTAIALQRLIDSGMSVVVVPFGSIEYDAGSSSTISALLSNQLGTMLALSAAFMAMT